MDGGGRRRSRCRIGRGARHRAQRHESVGADQPRHCEPVLKTTMRCLILSALAFSVVSCNQANALVVIDVTSQATLPALRLHCVATANQKTATFDVPAAGTLTLDSGKTFAVNVPNADAGSFAITITAVDGNGATLSTGQGTTTTHAGKRSDL